VAVVGRMEQSVSVIDHSEYLSEEQCRHPITTNGHAWLNKIQIWTESEPGPPPSDIPRLDTKAVASKLSHIRKTTAVGSHQEPGFSSTGQINFGSVPNDWATVYGRVVRSPRLSENCGPSGCGGDDVPLIILADPKNIRLIKPDGSPLPQQR
jgi:hypothetical protein